jgi:ATP-binding cassette subfamily F protein 3
VSPAQRQEQKKLEAAERQRRSALAKPIETRIKRLEEQMAKANAKKKLIDARLAEPAIYEEANKEELKTLMLDQAYLVRELDQAEGDWLEQQAELEKITAGAAS